MRHRKGTKLLLSVFLVVVLAGVWLFAVVNSVVFNYAQAQLDALTVQAVNLGIADVVDADVYGQLTDIRRDANGTITSISADVVAMNKLSTLVSAQAQKHLQELGQQGIPVPVGTFSGLPILVGRGLPVQLQTKLVGAVNCRFDSTFNSAGINQTQHKIMLCIDAVVDVVLPLGSKRTNVAVQMLFADSIIVGQVPEMMFTHTMNYGR